MRFASFAAVGACGFVLQIATLQLLLIATPSGPLAATFAAVELAVLHNFVWHERWTWRDRRGGAQTAGVVRRLVRFHVANGVTSIGAAVACVALLTRALGWPPALANCVAVGLTGLVNFVALDRWVFARPRRAL
ncbi:MAG TPA: GtrA family protein [Vicinamibacterales bacterium]|nr:GtrA family protein [Vicinamibacterales bacterium]